MQITKQTLENVVGHMRNETGIDFEIEYAYGAPRVMSDRGSRDVSPRMPKKELYYWMHAFLDGYRLCLQQHSRR